MSKPSTLYRLACALPLTLLAACATPTHQDVGAVVVAPQAQPVDLPVIVQQTQPKPAGYFLSSFLDYFKID